MAYHVERLDPGDRNREKQAARERDDALLYKRIISAEELQRANSLFAAFDVPKSVIVRGRRSVRVIV